MRLKLLKIKLKFSQDIMSNLCQTFQSPYSLHKPPCCFTLPSSLLSGAIALSYPPCFLMILVENFMLIMNHIETWVWKSTKRKLFTSKVLQKSWKVIKKRGLNTTIPSQCWKINTLQNNMSRIKPSIMKVKSKNNHEETQLEHHYSLAILKNRRQKIFEMAQEKGFLKKST